MSDQVKFALGKTVATPGALALLEEVGVEASSLLDRHLSGDWGDLAASDRKQNDSGLANGNDRLHSSYNLGPDAGCKKVWIITEWDRSVTTILLPEDY